VLRKDQSSKESLVEHLKTGICKVVFKKASKGNIKSLFCTLNPALIPGRYQNSLKGIAKLEKDDPIMPVFDIKEQSWKSFYVANLIAFFTPDELQQIHKTAKLKDKSLGSGDER
jgi:hypothetical protein